MGCKSEDYPEFLKLIFRLSNIHGALVTMPHKITTIPLLDEVMTTARIAGSCNAIRLDPDGRLIGDQFDGEGFVRGVLRNGQVIQGKKALVVGAGGVGSAIAASLAKAGISELAVFDKLASAMESLAARLEQHFPDLTVTIGSNDPADTDIVVNATPLGINDYDPHPVNVARIDPATFVGEVVMKQDMTPFLSAVRQRGCPYQVGTDMLYEQIPAYLEFFGFRSTNPDELREVAQISF